MIDRGVPNSPEDWPEDVLERLRVFVQGDIIRVPPLFYYADPKRPIWSETRRYQGVLIEPDVFYAESIVPEFGMVTTPTCEIAEEDVPRPLRPWVHVAPVFKLSGNSGHKKSLRAGRGPNIFVHLPKLSDGFWVADLRIEVPVEKGWLAFQERLDGFGSEEAQRVAGEKLSLRGRPAFSREFVQAVQRPLRVAFGTLYDLDEARYQTVASEIEEVGVRADSLLEMTRAQLVYLGSQQFSRTTVDWCNGWHNDNYAGVQAAGITMFAPEFADLKAMSVTEYRKVINVLRGELAGPRPAPG